MPKGIPSPSSGGRKRGRPASGMALIGQHPGAPSRARKYRREFCLVVVLMGAQGMFEEEWCSLMGVTLPTMRGWMWDEPEFYHAVTIARYRYAGFWSRAMRHAALGHPVDVPDPTELIELVRKLKGDERAEALRKDLPYLQPASAPVPSLMLEIIRKRVSDLWGDRPVTPGDLLFEPEENHNRRMAQIMGTSGTKGTKGTEDGDKGVGFPPPPSDVKGKPTDMITDELNTVLGRIDADKRDREG